MAKRNKLIKQKMFESIIGLLGLGITYNKVVKINKNLFYIFYLKYMKNVKSFLFLI